MQNWATADDMSDVLDIKELKNICIIDNSLVADEVKCEGLKCRDLCAIVIFQKDETQQIIRMQSPVLGAYDSDDGLCICIEGFCLNDSEPECCDTNDLLEMCALMHDSCKKLAWLNGIYMNALSGKRVISASTPAGRSVTFSKVSTQCLKDEIKKAEIECNMCNPCRRNDRCWQARF